MLVLSRKVNEEIQIGHNITVMVTRIRGSQVQLRIEAPPSVKILRGELKESKGGDAK